MKKNLFGILSAFILFASCSKDTEITSSPLEVADDVSVISERRCGTYEVFQAQLKADPGLQKRMDAIELYTKKIHDNPAMGRLVNGVIEIPVVVHVVWNTAQQNISLAQVQSQITVLNEDFNNTNADGATIPFEFKDEQTSVGIRFVLDRIVRVQTRTKSWSTNDAVKSSKRGGSNPVDASYYLNMWACNLGQGLLGYAQFPGGSLATDGVVILYSAFGSSAKAAGTYVNAYDLGRTATHEVGHWVNLRHIWGDATCGNDLIDDTPTAHTANYGCPGTIAGCTTNQPREMTMNYMDYTDDKCMYIFTNGQKGRINAVFAANGPRAAMGK